MSKFTNEQITNVVSTPAGISEVVQLLNGLDDEIIADGKVEDANNKVIVALKEMIEAQRFAIDARDTIIESYQKEVVILEKLIKS